MKKSIMAIAGSAAVALTLAACGSAPEDEATTDAGSEETSESAEEGDGDTGAASDVKACMVSDAGGFDDQSFNQAGFEGLQMAEAELGVEINTIESASEADFGPNVESLVADGCTYIIGVGFLLEQAIEDAAVANPDLHFALIDSSFTDADGNVIELDNAKPLLFNTAEASYLAGYVAAGMSETGTVGTFGGLPIPSVTVFMDGFVDGVAKFNEDNGADVSVLGWNKESQDGSFSGGFDDQSAGQNITQGFIDQGADVVMPVAGPVGLGAASALESAGEGHLMIWVDSDGFLTTDYGSIIPTSVMKEMGPAVFAAIEEQVNGEFTNAPYVGTLENEGVGLAPYHDFESVIPEDVASAVAELREQIISGEITVESENSPS